MKDVTVVQGRNVSRDDIALIIHLIGENPSWTRRHLSRQLCRLWDWRNGKGLLKDMACRTMLLKLEAAGHITLPPSLGGPNKWAGRRTHKDICHDTAPIEASLRDLEPVTVVPVLEREQVALCETFLRRYHYLGYRGIVGENMKYLIRDRRSRVLACMLFGSAAWRVGPRDEFVGWDNETRKRHLHLVTNNMRYLILPWVRVRYLASRVLSRVAARLSRDWIDKYGHSIHLLETFVQCNRFRGTCYQAANWIRVGRTKGRSRNDRDGTTVVPVKDVYLYPLTRHFRRELCGGA